MNMIAILNIHLDNLEVAHLFYFSEYVVDRLLDSLKRWTVTLGHENEMTPKIGDRNHISSLHSSYIL